MGLVVNILTGREVLMDAMEDIITSGKVDASRSDDKLRAGEVLLS